MRGRARRVPRVEDARSAADDAGPEGPRVSRVRVAHPQTLVLSYYSSNVRPSVRMAYFLERGNGMEERELEMSCMAYMLLSPTAAGYFARGEKKSKVTMRERGLMVIWPFALGQNNRTAAAG
jgi:hypothetical protein